MTPHEEIIDMLIRNFSVTQLQMVRVICQMNHILSPAEQLAIINEVLAEAITKKLNINH